MVSGIGGGVFKKRQCRFATIVLPAGIRYKVLQSSSVSTKIFLYLNSYAKSHQNISTLYQLLCP